MQATPEPTYKKPIASPAVWWALRLGSIVGFLALLVILSKVMGANLDPYYFQIIIQCGIYVILAVSLNLINGITGQFSIGHAGFFAVGAYIGAAWTMLFQPHVVKSLPVLTLGTPTGDALNLIIAIILGTAAAGIVGFFVGLP